MTFYKLSIAPPFAIPQFRECVSCAFAFALEGWRCSVQSVFTNHEDNCCCYLPVYFPDDSNYVNNTLDTEYGKRVFMANYLFEHAESILND